MPFSISQGLRLRRLSSIWIQVIKRVQRALLRRAKPIPQTYSVRDVVCFRGDNQPGKTTWSPASRVIGHEGNKKAGDAEALAHAILHGHSIIPEAIVRGQQELKMRQLYLHVEGSMLTATHVVPPHEDDGPLPSILENEAFNEPEARRERSRSPVPERAAASSSRRVSVAEPEAERTPTRRPTRDTTDDLPVQIRDPVLGKVRLQAMTQRKHSLLWAVEKLIAFMVNRGLTRLSISVSSRTCPVTWTTVGSPRLSNLT